MKDAMATISPLRPGDTIGFYSPSSPATYYASKRFERAKRYVQGRGYKLKAGSLTGRQQHYRSGTIHSRVEELNQLIRDPEVKCIMSTIGGMNSNSLLPYIDYGAFQETPKIMVGYSDVTAILLAIYAKTGVTTFYGPALVASLGEWPPLVDETWDNFESVCKQSNTIPDPYVTPEVWSDEFVDWEQQSHAKKTQKNQWVSVSGGIAKGRVIGGNLNTIMGIWGSEYMPKITQGDLLFLEDSLKDAATVERGFAFLKLNGVFDRVGGIILGKHEQFKDQGTGIKPYELLLEILAGQKLPIIADFDCCHTHPMLTLPIGASIEMDADRLQIALMDEVFK